MTVLPRSLFVCATCKTTFTSTMAAPKSIRDDAKRLGWKLWVGGCICPVCAARMGRPRAAPNDDKHRRAAMIWLLKTAGAKTGTIARGMRIKAHRVTELAAWYRRVLDIRHYRAGHEVAVISRLRMAGALPSPFSRCDDWADETVLRPSMTELKKRKDHFVSLWWKGFAAAWANIAATAASCRWNEWTGSWRLVSLEYARLHGWAFRPAVPELLNRGWRRVNQNALIGTDPMGIDKVVI